TAGNLWYPRKLEVAPRRASTSRATLSMSRVVTPGLAASRVFSCISATTLPARRILSSSSLRRIMAGSPRTPGDPAVVDGAHAVAGDLVGRPGPVDVGQQADRLVALDEG